MFSRPRTQSEYASTFCVVATSHPGGLIKLGLYAIGDSTNNPECRTGVFTQAIDGKHLTNPDGSKGGKKYARCSPYSCVSCFEISVDNVQDGKGPLPDNKLLSGKKYADCPVRLFIEDQLGTDGKVIAANSILAETGAIEKLIPMGYNDRSDDTLGIFLEYTNLEQNKFVMNRLFSTNEI